MRDIGIALAAFGEYDYDQQVPIERDASGVPVAWRVAPYGPWTVTRRGQTFVLVDVTEEVVDQIMNYYKQKGTKVPIDSRHFLYRLAEKYEVDEIDVIRMLPDGAGTFGFGELEKRSDGLWIVNVEYVELGRKLIAEGIFRYFSPVIRGLSTKQWRVTSVAMENEPATDNLYSFAASAEDRRIPDFSALVSSLDAFAASAEAYRQSPLNKENTQVKLLCKALGGLLGMDSIALGAENDVDQSVIDTINNLAKELPELREGKQATDGFLASMRDSLALGAEADLNAVQGAVASLKAKAATADELGSRVESLELSAEKQAHAKVVEQGRGTGQLVDSMMPWVNAQDSVALSAFLETAPVVVAPGKLNIKKQEKPVDSAALSAEESTIIAQAGISKEDYLANRPQ